MVGRIHSKKRLDSSSGKLVSGLQGGVEALPKAMHPSSAGRAGLLISEIEPKRVQSWRELWGDVGDIPLIVPKNCQQNPTTTLNQNMGKVTMRKALLRVSSHNGDSCGPVRLSKGNGAFLAPAAGTTGQEGLDDATLDIAFGDHSGAEPWGGQGVLELSVLQTPF